MQSEFALGEVDQTLSLKHDDSRFELKRKQSTLEQLEDENHGDDENLEEDSTEIHIKRSYDVTLVYRNDPTVFAKIEKNARYHNTCARMIDKDSILLGR